jgi:hypothetical protein
LDIGNTKFHALLKTKELESFKIGKSRKVILASIEAYVARQIEASNAAPPTTRYDDMRRSLPVDKADAPHNQTVNPGRLRGAD